MASPATSSRSQILMMLQLAIILKFESAISHNHETDFENVCSFQKLNSSASYFVVLVVRELII